MSPRRSRSVRHVAVVVPAHDEEELLGRALVSIREALAALPASLDRTLVVVADACRDRTEEVARAHGARVVRSAARSVGVARATGVESLRSPVGGTWVAMTDADCVVPPDWVTGQLEAARRGADLVVGRVRLDPADVSPEVLAAWTRAHAGEGTLDHVHGANLGFRLRAYRRVGGFAPLPEHEDVAFVDALTTSAVRIEPGPPVLTSGRLHNRVPGGFAGYLAALSADEQPSAS